MTGLQVFRTRKRKVLSLEVLGTAITKETRFIKSSLIL